MINTTEIPASLEDACPLWIYTANRILTAEDKAFLSSHFGSFSAQWQSHGRKVESFFEIVHDRFLVIAADVAEGDISGCGIDASVRQISKLAATRDIEWISAMNIALAGSTVKVLDRMEFRLLAEKGEIDSQSVVFDTSINRVGQWRAGEFSKPVSASWHAKLLPQVA